MVMFFGYYKKYCLLPHLDVPQIFRQGVRKWDLEGGGVILGFQPRYTLAKKIFTHHPIIHK